MAYFAWFALEARTKQPLFLTAAAVILLPVGWSRTVSRDHSWPQVCVGALVGIALGALWFFLLRLRCTRWSLKSCTATCPILKDNYYPEKLEEESAEPPS